MNELGRAPDTYKVCLCGAESVGKTSLVVRQLHTEFYEDDDPTIEDNHIYNITVDDKKCKLEILDTGGSGAYSHLHDKWFNGPNAFILVFSVCAKYSFDMIPNFIKEIEKIRTGQDYSLILVGTQVDEPKPRETTKEQALEIAYEHGCNYFETSAKTGTNVATLFEEMVRELRTKRKEIELLSSYANMKPQKKKRTIKFWSSTGKREVQKKKQIEERNVEMDSALSILKNPDLRKKLCKVIPKHRVVSLKTKTEVTTIQGPPDDFSTQSYKDYVCARGVSTYPLKSPNSNEREGDPIADQYFLTHFENRTIIALADGCNWGPEVQLAARKSVRIFNEYMRKHQREIETTREVGYIILRAFLTAHNSIIEGRTEETIFQAGTTTMIGGMVLELEGVAEEKWGFVCASLGDCKAFRWNSRTGEVVDVTHGNRKNITDARDPGGRLGPYLEGGAPDLRNLSIFFTPCFEGDILVVVSDGVHDNLDPQQLGKLPSDLNIRVKDDSWSSLDELKDDVLYEEAQRVKALFAKKFMTAMIGGEKSLRPESRTTPASIVGKFTEHCLAVTRSSREFMEKNPGKKLPKDYSQFPGKMDHSTCVAFEVGLKKCVKVPPVHKQTNALYWEEFRTDKGQKYFYNTVTRKTIWEDPFLKEKNSNWKAFYDEDGEVYYHNSVTGEATWDPPKNKRS